MKPRYSISADDCDNPRLNRTSALARLVYAYLPCFADPEGGLEDNPGRLRVLLLPNDDQVNMDEVLAELEKAKMLTRYEAEGVRWIQLERNSVTAQRRRPPPPRETSDGRLLPTVTTPPSMHLKTAAKA